jgi:hypothetical protein
MAKPPIFDDPQPQAATLRIPERILLFCIAEWKRAGLTGATVTAYEFAATDVAGNRARISMTSRSPTWRKSR